MEIWHSGSAFQGICVKDGGFQMADVGFCGLHLQRTRAQTGVGLCPWLPSLALGVGHPSPSHVPSSWR